VAEHDDVVLPLFLLLRQEDAAQERRALHHREEAVAHLNAGNPLGLAAPDEGRGPFAVGRDLLEDALLAPPVVDVRGRDLITVLAFGGRIAPDEDDPFGLAVRQSL
jgi:hypothetical protein